VSAARSQPLAAAAESEKLGKGGYDVMQAFWAHSR
jgi:hypothetical protein